MLQVRGSLQEAVDGDNTVDDTSSLSGILVLGPSLSIGRGHPLCGDIRTRGSQSLSYLCFTVV